jgi:hypothetical protein
MSAEQIRKGGALISSLYDKHTSSNAVEGDLEDVIDDLEVLMGDDNTGLENTLYGLVLSILEGEESSGTITTLAFTQGDSVGVRKYKFQRDGARIRAIDSVGEDGSPSIPSDTVADAGTGVEGGVADAGAGAEESGVADAGAGAEEGDVADAGTGAEGGVADAGGAAGLPKEFGAAGLGEGGEDIGAGVGIGEGESGEVGAQGKGGDMGLYGDDAKSWSDQLSF